MKNIIFFNDISPSITIFIVSYSIILSGHYTSRREDKAESGPGLRISDAEESDGIGKTRISFSVEFDWGVERASTHIFPEYISRAHVNIIL